MEIEYISALSLFIPTIFLLWRIKKIDPIYYLFAVFLGLGLINEIVSEICIAKYMNNAVNSNIYSLLEGLTLLALLSVWKVMERNFTLVCGILLASIWFWENIIAGDIATFNGVSVIFYSLIVVVGSVLLIFQKMFITTRNLLKDAQFILAFAFVVFFAFAAVIEILMLAGMANSKSFLGKVYQILTIINILISILYTYAVLCMEKKLRFSTRY